MRPLGGTGCQQAVAVLHTFGEAEFFTADVTSDSDVARMINDVVSRFGRLDHAFNNAANTEAATGAGGFSAMQLAEFEGIVRASLTAYGCA